MDLGAYACYDCGAPLRFSAISGLKCPNAKHGQIDCAGRDPFNPRGPMARVVDKYVCSGGCGRVVKWRDGEPQPVELRSERDCECGGMLVFKARQTR